MATINIGGADREITFRKLTRSEARQVEEITMQGLVVTAGMKPENIAIPAVNAMRADELQVMFTSGLTQAELDGMGDDEYKELKALANAWVGDNKKK